VGRFGMVLPNLLATGIRRVERRSLATGGVVTSASDSDGLWPSGAQTVNPVGGPTAVVLSGCGRQLPDGRPGARPLGADVRRCRRVRDQDR
jgi:hypothetical protein